MRAAVQTWLTPLLAVAVPVCTFAAVRWQRSGKVSSSEAADLWMESREIRRDLREDYRQIREELAGMRAENDSMRAEMTSLQLARADCLERLAAAGLLRQDPP